MLLLLLPPPYGGWTGTGGTESAAVAGALLLLQMIYLLNRNDLADAQGKELLRKTVYWWCLNDYLKQHAALTKFVLLMVDNNRSLPIIGAPPGMELYDSLRV